MRSRRVAIAAALAAVAVHAAPPATTVSPAAPWRSAEREHRWSFPRDHHAHPEYRNEWWYFTGLLTAEGAPGQRFGYQLTWFRVGLVPDPPALDSDLATGAAVMGHAAVTDLAAGKHAFSEVIWRAAGPLGGFGVDGEPLLAFARAPAGTEGRWTLRLLPDGGFALAMRDAGRALALDLTVRPEGPPVLQGPDGYSRKSAREGYASLYYSYPRMATDGTLSRGGRTFRVHGTTWMDRELGSSQLAPEQRGWDWFSLRLADGRALTLYALRRADGSVDWRNGTLVERGGAVALLGPDDWTAEVDGRWTSPATGARYPSGWRVRVPRAGLDVRVAPEVQAAENVSTLVPGLSYWEGPVRVTGPDGAAAGEGYVELTGYVAEGRLPL